LHNCFNARFRCIKPLLAQSPQRIAAFVQGDGFIERSFTVFQLMDDVFKRPQRGFKIHIGYVLIHSPAMTPDADWVKCFALSPSVDEEGC
jgi:hypothetical protein